MSLKLEISSIQACSVFHADVHCTVMLLSRVRQPKSGVHPPPKKESVQTSQKVYTGVHSVHSVLGESSWETRRWILVDKNDINEH